MDQCMHEEMKKHYGFANVRPERKDEIYNSILIDLVSDVDLQRENMVKHTISIPGDVGNLAPQITFFFVTKSDLIKFESLFKKKFGKEEFIRVEKHKD